MAKKPKSGLAAGAGRGLKKAPKDPFAAQTQFGGLSRLSGESRNFMNRNRKKK